ncbi:hypothetical protein JHFBIEKO_3280 [Methylobacterium mesophilicum]|nr:hypothetical protein JHFBIEKO_3280 [Methylobacterium mesophilicum]
MLRAGGMFGAVGPQWARGPRSAQNRLTSGKKSWNKTRTNVMGSSAMRSHDQDPTLAYAIAELRLSPAFIALRLLDIKAGFRPDQPRDCNGRWCGGNGSLTVVRRDRTGDARIDAKTDARLDVLKDVVESTEPGKGFYTVFRSMRSWQRGCVNWIFPVLAGTVSSRVSSPVTSFGTVFQEAYARMCFSGMVEPAPRQSGQSGTSRPVKKDYRQIAFAH